MQNVSPEGSTLVTQQTLRYAVTWDGKFNQM